MTDDHPCGRPEGAGQGEEIAHTGIKRSDIHKGPGLNRSRVRKQIRIPKNLSERIDKSADARVGRPDEKAPVFHGPEYGHGEMLIGRAALAVPGIVGDVDQQVRAVFRRRAGQFRKDDFIADEGADLHRILSHDIPFSAGMEVPHLGDQFLDKGQKPFQGHVFPERHQMALAVALRNAGAGIAVTNGSDGTSVFDHDDEDDDAEDDGDPTRDQADRLAGGFRERLLANLQDSLVDLSEGLVTGAVSGAHSVVAGVLSLVFGIFVVLMAAAYTLIDAPGMLRFVEQRFPLRRREGLRELLGLFDQGMRGVVRGQVTICVVNGLLSLAGFSFLIPEYALILALVAGVLSFIPIFGTVISSIPAVLVGLSVDLQTALLVLGWILLIHFLEAYILNPKIIGREAHIHPVIVVVAVVAGERVFGVPGAFLAVPTAAALKALIVFAYRRSGASGA